MPTKEEKKKAAGKQTWMYSKQCRLLEKNGQTKSKTETIKFMFKKTPQGYVKVQRLRYSHSKVVKYQLWFGRSGRPADIDEPQPPKPNNQDAHQIQRGDTPTHSDPLHFISRAGVQDATG